jgi:hypothetical protein
MFVLSASAMRSGSSWFLNMTNDLLVASGYSSVREISKDERMRAIIQNDFADIAKPRYTKLIPLIYLSWKTGPFVVKTHSFPSRGTRFFSILRQIKSTYIYRDPRDRLVSLMEMGERARKEGDSRSPFWGMHEFETALAHLRQALPHKQRWEQHPQTLLVRYEDLVHDPLRVMLQVNHHLGLSLSQDVLQGIIDRYNKRTLKKDERLTNFSVGEIGRYKEVLTGEQIRAIDHMLRDDLIALGYEPDPNS